MLMMDSQMLATWIAWARAMLSPVDQRNLNSDRSEYERFALPHAFKPQLSFTEAVVSVAGAFLRIVLGSLVFAFWGTYSLVAWTSIRNLFVRVVAVLLLLVLFLLTFTLLMLAIAAIVRTASRKRPETFPIA